MGEKIDCRFPRRSRDFPNGMFWDTVLLLPSVQSSVFIGGCTCGLCATKSDLQGGKAIPNESAAGWSVLALLLEKIARSIEHDRERFIFEPHPHVTVPPTDLRNSLRRTFPKQNPTTSDCSPATAYPVSLILYCSRLTLEMVAFPNFRTQGCARYYIALPLDSEKAESRDLLQFRAIGSRNKGESQAIDGRCVCLACTLKSVLTQSFSNQLVYETCV